MKFKELKKYLTNKRKQNFFYLEGDDAYFRERAQEMIVNSFVTAYPEMNLTALSSPDITQINDSCSVLPFMSESRAVIIKEYYPSAQDVKKLASIKFSECVLIISNSQKSSIKSTENSFVDCNKESVPQLSNWIITMFKAHNKQISFNAANMLASFCGQDMMRITREIEKLSLLPQTELSEEDIEQNVPKEVDYQAYMLAKAVTERQNDVYQILADFVNKGRAESHLLISLYNNFKRMYYVKDSLHSKKRLSEFLNIKPYAVAMSIKTAKDYDKEMLSSALKILSDAEYNIKSGSFSGINALYFTVASLLKKSKNYE